MWGLNQALLVSSPGVHVTPCPGRRLKTSPVQNPRAYPVLRSWFTELKVGLTERKVFDFVKPKVKITDIDSPATPTDGEDR
jgi:hypothetical protein